MEKGKTNNDKMVGILRRLKPETNGAVTGEMEKRGIRYGLNYGVAVPVIRRVAREYAPDHTLAEYLFRQDVRELKLAAVYVDDPARVTAEQMERWASAMPADEVMEHAAMSLFYASPDADGILTAWLSGDDRRRRKGALHMAGRRAMTGLCAPGESGRRLREIEASIAACGEPPQRAAVYALCRIAESGPELRTETRNLLERLSHSPQDPVREIAEEAAALLGV